MSTVDRLIELETQVTLLKEKIDAAFKKIDENREERRVQFDELLIYRTKLDICMLELQKLDLPFWVRDVDKFIKAVKKWLWIVVSVCTTTVLASIITMLVKGTT